MQQVLNITSPQQLLTILFSNCWDLKMKYNSQDFFRRSAFFTGPHLEFRINITPLDIGFLFEAGLLNPTFPFELPDTIFYRVSPKGAYYLFPQVEPYVSNNTLVYPSLINCLELTIWKKVYGEGES